jgi:hypothetical protein
MDTETLGIMLGVVLPLYPLLVAIYQKIGKYDEIVEEFSHQGHLNRGCFQHIVYPVQGRKGCRNADMRVVFLTRVL